jgi:hypothetical protein
LTDPDSDNLKAAAEYLLEVARSSEGRRYRKQPKMDALREYKAEIVEAHRHGLNVHRIAEIFRERGVDISKIHLMRAIRRFIEEEEKVGGKGSAGQGASTVKATRSEAIYQVVEQPSAVVREEEFAKQLRIARYLAGASAPAARPAEQAPAARAPEQVRPVRKAESKAKVGPARQKAGEAELAKERRRAGRVGHKPPLSGPSRGAKQRPGPDR